MKLDVKNKCFDDAKNYTDIHDYMVNTHTYLLVPLIKDFLTTHDYTNTHA